MQQEDSVHETGVDKVSGIFELSFSREEGFLLGQNTGSFSSGVWLNRDAMDDGNPDIAATQASLLFSQVFYIRWRT